MNLTFGNFIFLMLAVIAGQLFIASGEPFQIQYRTAYKNKQYYIDSVFYGNWYAAIKRCQSLGMKLVSLETQDENNFIYNNLSSIFPKQQHFFWTSGNRLVNNKTWNWFTSFTPITTFNWYEGEPNNVPEPAKCITVSIAAQWFGPLGNETRWWGDSQCETGYCSVICEKELPNGNQCGNRCCDRCHDPCW